MLRKSVDVAGKTVLITGGARGMGRLWAEHLLRDGARVALWDLNEAELATTAADFARGGHSVPTAVVDVTDRERVYAAAKELLAAVGTVDVVLNNAGIVAAGPFLEVPDAKLAKTIDVNLTSFMWTTKAFLPAMLAKGAGHFVNISSAAGFIGVPFMPAYSASKWGVIGFTEALRLEMKLTGHKGIRFTLVCPSFVDTGMFRGVRAPKMVPLLTPEECVGRCYKAFRAGDYMIKEPFMVKFTEGLHAVLPTAIYDIVSDTLGVTSSMSHWTGHEGK